MLADPLACGTELLAPLNEMVAAAAGVELGGVPDVDGVPVVDVPPVPVELPPLLVAELPPD